MRPGRAAEARPFSGPARGAGRPGHTPERFSRPGPYGRLFRGELWAGGLKGLASAEAAIERNIAPGALAGSVTRGRRANWWLRRGSKRRGFRYETPAGKRVADEAALERIKSLVI